MITTHLRATARPLALAALALLAVAGPALGAVREGTNRNDTLVGTNGKDSITGKGGNDTLKGLAGNDTYHFAAGWGEDTLEEKATYKVDGKNVPGGVDTLSFKGVTNEFGVSVFLIPEWRGEDRFYNEASIPNADEVVDMGASIVENVVGTSLQADFIQAGGAANRLSSGGGKTDELWDLGGYDDGAGNFPDLSPSNDTFAGLAANTGFSSIRDYGGNADVLDLRPLRSDKVVLNLMECDGDPAKECLQIVTPTSNESQVIVQGQFGAYFDETELHGQQGRIETIRFADGSFRFDGRATRGSGADAGEALLGKVETKEQQQLAERAPVLADQAREQARQQPAAGITSTDRGR